MSKGQETFLNRIRTSLRQSLLPAASPQHPGPFLGYSFAPDLPLEDKIGSFSRELTALSGQVHLPADETQAVSLVLEILYSHQADRIIAWDKACLELPALGPALEKARVRVEDSRLAPFKAERLERLAALDDVRVGLSGAQGGLADTGSLALISGPGQGRLASLLPPVHIALLPARNLYPSLPAFLAAHPDVTGEGSNLVLITGPSRTADIEMTLAMGVHGPRDIHVVILGWQQ